jgi:hypothetical protein
MKISLTEKHNKNLDDNILHLKNLIKKLLGITVKNQAFFF